MALGIMLIEITDLCLDNNHLYCEKTLAHMLSVSGSYGRPAVQQTKILWYMILLKLHNFKYAVLKPMCQ